MEGIRDPGHVGRLASAGVEGGGSEWHFQNSVGDVKSTQTASPCLQCEYGELGLR